MKLTAFLIILSLAQISAKTLAQNLTIKVKNASAITVLNEISAKSKYLFVYDERVLKQTPKITLDLTEKSINEILDNTFKDSKISYFIRDRYITLKTTEETLFDKANQFIKNILQDITVRGRVVDENGAPLSGAKISVKGRPQSSTTDVDGRFMLANVNEDGIIIITYIGYNLQELRIKPDMGTIRMLQNTGNLEEVSINAGYYSVSDRERTGNISRVSGEEIRKQPINNPLMALQGRVAGLEITQQTGLPGGSFNVRIRGQNSIKSGNDPLYVIDGVTFPSTRISGDRTSSILGTNGASPLSTLNPNDIESIEILKDADATSIYGSRGANGVILITTKHGMRNVNNISAEVSRGFSEVAHFVELLSTEQYLKMRNEGLKNDDLPIAETDFDINGTWDNSRYTNWQEELIGNKTPLNRMSLSYNGGGEKNTYLLTANYYDEGTVFPGDFGFKRLNSSANINIGGINDRLKTSFTTAINYTNSNLPSNIINNIFLPPNQPASKDEFGNINWANNTVVTNPMASLLQTNKAQIYNLNTSLNLDYTIIKNLEIKSTLGYTLIKRDELQKTPLASYAPIYNFPASMRETLFGNHSNNNLLFEPQLSYKLQILGGTINALAGASLQRSDSQLKVLSASNFSSDDLMENIGAASTLRSDQNTFSEYRYSAVFGRLNYSLDKKYLINFTARRDGSSRFGPGKQFANFAAVGAAWIFSEESIITNNLKFLSFGKLRISYGTAGNDQIQDYAYLQLWNNNTIYDGISTLKPSGSAPNSDFAWEVNRKLEASLELKFLDDKIDLKTTYYKNRSANLLLYQLLPLSAGLGGTFRNFPATVQNTGWEIESSIDIIKSQNLNWNLNFNLTIPRNTLISYDGLNTSSDAINYEIGKPLSILKTYNVFVDRNTGLYNFEDKNGNGVRDDEDRYISKFLGQQFYGGLQNSISYKNFNISFHFTLSKQTSRGYRNAGNFSPGIWFAGATSNQFTEVLNRWQPSNVNTAVQKYSASFSNYFLNDDVKTYGNLTIVDASYIRLRNLSISYMLPKALLSIFKIREASINVTGQNIFTITKYIGLDPETQNERLPPLRTIMTGINLTF